MQDIAVLEQMVNSMADAVEKLEELGKGGRADEFSKLKAFIFDLHKKIDSVLEVK